MAGDQDPLAEAVLPAEMEQSRALVALEKHWAGLSGLLPVTGLRRPQGRPAKGSLELPQGRHGRRRRGRHDADREPATGPQQGEELLTQQAGLIPVELRG
jgi:hypothetical protein